MFIGSSNSRFFTVVSTGKNSSFVTVGVCVFALSQENITKTKVHLPLDSTIFVETFNPKCIRLTQCVLIKSIPRAIKGKMVRI